MKKLAMILALTLMLSAVPLMAQTATTSAPTGDLPMDEGSGDPIPSDTGGEPTDDSAPPAELAN